MFFLMYSFSWILCFSCTKQTNIWTKIVVILLNEVSVRNNSCEIFYFFSVDQYIFLHIDKFMGDEMSNFKAWYEFPFGKDILEIYARSHKLFNSLWCTFYLWMATSIILQHLYEKLKWLTSFNASKDCSSMLVHKLIRTE